MELVYVAFGSNLGDRSAHIEKAKTLLQENGLKVERTSSILETEPVGGPPQGKFLNGVFEIRTNLKPRAVLEILEAIERQMGRTEKGNQLPRTMDLDILFFGTLMLSEKDLVIPHPRLHERLFALQPMAELAPHYYHPKLGKTVQEMLQDLSQAA